jgi:hypothetical protein
VITKTITNRTAQKQEKEEINELGLDFKSLSKNPERQSIRSEKFMRKIRGSKDRQSIAESQRDYLYSEAAYQELTILINQIEDPDNFEFYAQICEIHEKFKTCHMEHIVNYFNILVNVLGNSKK